MKPSGLFPPPANQASPYDATWQRIIGGEVLGVRIFAYAQTSPGLRRKPSRSHRADVRTLCHNSSDLHPLDLYVGLSDPFILPGPWKTRETVGYGVVDAQYLYASTLMEIGRGGWLRVPAFVDRVSRRKSIDHMNFINNKLRKCNRFLYYPKKKTCIFIKNI